MLLKKIILFSFIFLISVISNAQISGTVYRDLPLNGTILNIYGVKDVNELGVEGVTVTVYPGGASTTTAADGTWSLAGNGELRVEFSSWPDYLEESSDGGGTNTSVQFVTAPNANIDFGLHDPIDFSNDVADIGMTFFVNNSGADGSLFTVRVLRNDDIPGAPNTAGLAVDGDQDNNGPQSDQPIKGDKVGYINETGSVWGVAYNRETKDLYVSSAVRRYTAMGPSGIGAIYKIDNSNTVSLFTTVANAGNITPNASRDLADDSNNPSHDPVFDEVGRIGLGDIDISSDNKHLYTINVNTNEFVDIEISDPTNQNQYSIGNPFGATCPLADVKSWGIGQHNGKIYVGSVCTTNMTSGAYISEFDGTSFTPIHHIPLDMDGETSTSNSGGGSSIVPHRWRTWITDYNDLFDHWRACYPSPILGNIEFDEEDGMILGFVDRTSMQAGMYNYSPEVSNTTSYYYDSGGDIIRVCKVSGQYYNEGTAQCPQQPARTSPATNYTSYPEYFGGEEYNPHHGENASGGLAYQQGSNRVLTTAFDPVDLGYNGDNSNWENSGIEWLDTDGGEKTSGIRMAGGSGSGVGKAYLGKAGGIGDVEYMNDPAPIEIGNLVWEDTDDDGIQDPGEPGISGVEVKLFQGAVELATATTDANGNYIFSNDPNGASTASHRYNITQLVASGVDYSVVIENINGGSKQAALGMNSLTSPNTGEGSNANRNDSDGTENGTRAEVDVLPTDIPRTGANNHDFDFGFRDAPPCPATQCGTVTTVKN